MTNTKTTTINGSEYKYTVNEMTDDHITVTWYNILHSHEVEGIVGTLALYTELAEDLEDDCLNYTDATMHIDGATVTVMYPIW